MKLVKWKAVAVAIVLCGTLGPAPGLFAEDTTRSQLRQGIDLFAQGLYSHAVLVLRSVVLNPQAKEEKAEAYFWLTKSYMAQGNLDDAEKSLEFYLTNYAAAKDYPEAYYLKGRLLFRQGEYENAIQVLANFLQRYKDSPLVANAYFWTAESLYSLGKIDDALTLFRKVIQDYPKSYKIEAARYRVSIIGFKKRENELLKLLKWSHQELLQTVESSRRREQTYEQAIASYQKQIAEYEQADYRKTIAALKSGISERDSTITSLKKQVATLENALEAAKESAKTAAAGAQSGSTVDGSLVELLKLKTEALALKERILARLTGGAVTQ